MPRPIFQVRFIGFLVTGLFLLACSNPVQPIANSDSETLENSAPTDLGADVAVNQDEGWAQFVPSICELMDNPETYNGKEIRTRTTFVRIGSEQWFRDESCVTRHPIFDAEFKSSFHELICNDKVHFSDNLCDLVTPTRTNIDIAVTAVFSGRFEFYRTNKGFTRNGQRFRLKVADVASITDMQNLKKETPK